MMLKTAFKNILGAGKRTWLNVTVLSFTFVLMVGYNGVLDGWKEEARRDTMEWETGAGQLWHPQYDRYDIFTLPDAHGPIPSSLQPYIDNKNLTPILVTQGVLYPQGRMLNVLIRGIDPNQSILSLPSSLLHLNHVEPVAIIGSRTAESTKLNVGNRVMVRWRDKNGAFDAREVLIIHIFQTKVPAIDAGQLWINLEQLQQMTGMPHEATYFVASRHFPYSSDIDGWRYKDMKFLMADLDLLIKGGRIESIIIFCILMAIALLAVFDTQTLSIFRRQKEIGTYVALGMTPRRVMLLFTLEGTCFSILAIIASLFWGTPVLAWFAQIGYKMPDMVNDMGMVIGNVLYPLFKASSILVSAGVVVGLSAVISYLPARKIAKQNVVEALKGKIA
jgi:ABC-type lipoprotein release transport system permease subunit